MKVESNSGLLPQQDFARSQDRRVQSAFSQVLEAAGRQGYASAQPAASGPPTGEGIQATWSSWFDTQRSGRYAEAKSPEQLKQGFGEVLVRANAEGGYVAPKEFLKSLSAEELQVVQNVHWLADPINVDSLSEEGALNLLLPPAAQVDLNRDGITQSGAANGIRFPDSNTPADVTQAWDEATAGMPLRERMLFELQMTMPILTANIVLDENGAFSHRYEPGDPGYTNPMAKAGYSYRQAAQDRLEYLDLFKNQMPIEQYQKQTEFWTRMHGLLEEHGAL